MREALFYEEFPDEYEHHTIRCTLCPHFCVLKPGQAGLCKVRNNDHGVMYSLNYGRIASISMDPIEKKPLYHFHPGQQILSVGSWGCNFRCPWCQNWEIAQEKPTTQNVYADRLIDIAINRESDGIAFTYNEPLVWFEFILDSTRMANANGLYNVLVTNGFVNEEPFQLLLQTVNAMNIDLKGFDPKWHKKRCGGDVEVVKQNILRAHQEDVHIEITTLIIPGENDDERTLRQQFEWLASISQDIPLHLSRYYPAYQFQKPATDASLMLNLHKIAREYLHHVYLGNLPDQEFSHTRCVSCSHLLISRVGYEIQMTGVNERGDCTQCGKKQNLIL